MTEEERAEYERWMTPPPRWLIMCQWAATLLFSLTGALVVMEQWMIWFIWFSQFFSSWGMAFGVVLLSAQLVWMFGSSGKERESCPI